MKIVHIAPNAPYNDYWGYQDNLLPKYQRKLGHNVVMITTTLMHKDGGIVQTDSADYVLTDGVRVIRKKYRQYFHPEITRVLSHLEVYDLLEELQPDFIFYHGLLSYTVYDVVKYVKKHPNCQFVEDNHLDYNIGDKADTWRLKASRARLRLLNRIPSKYVSKVYGVTPWRKTYAEDYFRIPASKTDVLIMGADDEKMDLAHRPQLRQEMRALYHISDQDFLIVTGGKIDRKKKSDLLMQACAELGDVKLLVFGNVAEDVREQFDALVKQENILYVGWIESDQVYRYFYAADLVFFPGQHSVLWEQACASKTPCVFEKWEGMDHVNNGGNSDFVAPVTVETIKEKIRQLHFTEQYYAMKAAAESEKTDIYLYSHIARKSLEVISAEKRM